MIDSDDNLAERAKRGDRMALEALLERHAPLAARVAFAVLRNEADALDAAQNALVQIAQNIQSTWTAGSFTAWVGRCAHYQAVDLLRKNRARKQREDARSAEKSAMEAPMRTSDRLEKEELSVLLHEELGELPQQTASALLLYHVEGLAVADVAEKTALTLDACKQRLVRGREELRERLERRGIGAASLALLPAVLDQLGTAAQAWAARADPAKFSKIAKAAAGAALIYSLAQSSSNPSTHPASPSAHASTAESAARTVPIHEGPRMPSNRSVVLTAALTLGACGAILCFFNLTSRPPVERVERQPEPKSGVANAPAVVATKSQPPSRDVAPRWQTPRLVTNGGGEPLSIASSGLHAAILVKSSQKDRPESPELLLVESVDGGQSWMAGREFSGYSNGAVAVDAEGNCVILGMVPIAGKHFVRMPSIFVTEGCDRVDWLFRPAGGQFGKPEVVWSAPASEAAFVYQPKLVAAAGRVWAFSLQLRNSQDQQPQVRIATGKMNECPKPLPVSSSGWSTEHPAGWACDALRAGFIAATDDSKQLQHFSTGDGGATWSATAIPVVLPESAPGKIIEAIPVCAGQCGQHLTVMVNIKLLKSHALIGFQQESYVGFILHSADLGKSWGVATAVTKPVAFDGSAEFAGTGMFGLHLTADKMIFLHTRVKLGREDILTAGRVKSDMKPHSMKAPALISEDYGQSWRDYHALESIISQTAPMVCVGGDDTSVHVAIPVSEGLIIRSFAAGDWKAPASPLPAWFKEEKLPEPTPEEF